MKFGQALRPLLPAALKAKVPARRAPGKYPTRSHKRRMILLEGCVQPAMAPNINTATARVLDALGIELVRPAGAGCCGAIRYHLSDHDGGLDDARRNIDAWWPLVEAGVEAIVMNASGCGLQVKEYGHLLARDHAVRRARATHQRADAGHRGTPAGAGRRTQAQARRGDDRQGRLPFTVHAAARPEGARRSGSAC